MAELRQEIIEWLHQRPNWMQETADRLLSNGELKDGDIQEIATLLKTKEGQKASNHRTFTGLSSSQGSKQTLRLLSIGAVKGIDKLAPREPLSFGNGNLTVIYGHNGSGKSGYSRILKRVCGKPRAEKLKSNVFDEAPSEQGCTIGFEENGKSKNVIWDAKGTHLSELEAVDIFDGDEAGFYLTKETNVSYTPPEVLLFENLASACDRVKNTLQEEQDKLISKLPSLPSKFANAKIGKKYNSISASISKEEYATLTEWTKKEQQSLEQLKERLKGTDPLKLASSKRKKKQAVDQIITEIKTAHSLLCTEPVDQFCTLIKEANQKRKTATEGAKAQTQSAKLEGVGTETWRALWEAAKAYSTSEAYPEKEFPATEEGDRCVLCHQELQGEAPDRLKDFERFVKGKLEKGATTAEEKLQNAIEKLPSSPDENIITARCETAGISEDLENEIITFWDGVLEKVTELKKAKPDFKYQGLNEPKSILESLTASSESYSKQIEQHELDAKKFNRKETEQKVLELEAKLWASQQKEAIKEEVFRLKKRKNYDDWIQLTSSRSVSLQAGKISKKAITEAYVKRFNDELKALGAKRIQVKIVKTRIDYGKTLHQIRLKDVEQENGASTAVLSDGERRIVSLAAFLADVTGRPESSPFVFDDPISSLDHEFEWEVAMRLAKLATERQVIVLTHRLSLYGVLEEAEKKVRIDLGLKKYLEQRCIETFSGTTGHPADQQAWTQSTKSANNTLIRRLDDARKYWDSGDSNSYKIHAQSICSDFRKLLERTVEDDLIQEVVKRHRRSIMTNNKLNGLVKIQQDDAQFLDELMTKYSKFEHSQSAEIPVQVPGEPELRKDLEALKTWREKFKKRTL